MIFKLKMKSFFFSAFCGLFSRQYKMQQGPRHSRRRPCQNGILLCQNDISASQDIPRLQCGISIAVNQRINFFACLAVGAFMRIIARIVRQIVGVED